MFKRKHEGNEQMTETAETTAVVEDQVTDVAKTSPEDKEQWDKSKQMVDFERNNAARARQELASVTEALTEANDRTAKMEEKLDELQQAHEADKQRLEQEKVELAEMDPDLVDKGVIDNIRQLQQSQRDQQSRFQEERKQLQAQIKDLRSKATEYEQSRADQVVKAQHAEAKERVLTTADEFVGAQFRTRAIEIADELVDTGKETQPKTETAAIKLMLKCYKQAESESDKAKETKTKGTAVPVDRGISGVLPPTPAPTRKTGTLDDVASDMLQDKSWLD